MSTPKPKLYIADCFCNRISHRSLTAFEERNRKVLPRLQNTVFDSWEAAHAWLVADRRERLERAAKELKAAEKALARARAMVKPEQA